MKIFGSIKTYHELMAVTLMIICNKDDLLVMICHFFNICFKKLFHETSGWLLFGIHTFIDFPKKMNLNQQTEIKIK